MLTRQTKANSFAAPITAFDISPRGNFLGTGTSEGTCCCISLFQSPLRAFHRGHHCTDGHALLFLPSGRDFYSILSARIACMQRLNIVHVSDHTSQLFDAMALSHSTNLLIMKSACSSICHQGFPPSCQCFQIEFFYYAGDVATFSADDLRPLQRVKGAHMVFTTALTFSKDEQSMLTVSADASALATRVSRTPTSSPFQLYFILSLIACVMAVICCIVLSKGSKASAVLSQQADVIQEGAQRHAYLTQEL